MDANLFSVFIHAIFLSFIALLPLVNPVGTALIVEPFLQGLAYEERRQSALTIAFYALLVCLVTLLFGGIFFKFFGISVPAVQIAGGIMICRMAWGILSPGGEGSNQEGDVSTLPHKHIRAMLFFPLSFPTTAGAGTISVILTLSANAYSENFLTHMMNLAAIGAAAFIMCVLVFVCLNFAPVLMRKMSEQGQLAMNRLSGFLTFCVGVQIFLNGVTGVIHTLKL